MLSNRIAFTFLILFVQVNSLFASHIIGGDMSVQNIAGDRYELKLNLYYDALDGEDVVEDSVLISSFRKSDNQRIEDFFLINKGNFDKPDLSNDLCLDGLNIRIYTYSAQIFLAKSLYYENSGYYLSWQRCCRSNNISNLQNSGFTGFVFYAEIPNLDTYQFNSSPIFNKISGNYYCSGQDVNIDFSCKDRDGDRLEYSLVNPLSGISNSDDRIVIGVPGPYAEPVGYSNIPGVNNLNLDSNGVLSFTAQSSGLYLVPMKCEEFRGNVKIGEVRREITILIRNCESNSAPQISLFPYEGIDPYQSGDTVKIRTKEDLCHRIEVKDSDPDEKISIQVSESAVPISISPISGQVNGDILISKLCLDDCQDIDVNFFDLTISALDDHCPDKAQADLKINFLIVESENRPPEVYTDYLPKDFKTGDKIEFNVFSTDPDSGEISNISISSSDFKPSDLGMEFIVEMGLDLTQGRFIWEPNCSNLLDIENYKLLFTSSDGNCGDNSLDTISANLFVERIEEELFKNDGPSNVVTANFDGYNDYFSLPFLDKSNCLYQEFEKIEIYNRWGRKVFTSTQIDFRWIPDQFPAGKYFYLLDFGEKNFKGILNLLN